MVPLNLPVFTFQYSELNGKKAVFDILRKKYIILTPEEWVRQNFVRFLIDYHQYPKGLIKLETGVKYNQLTGRSDIVVLDRQGENFMLVECKAPEILIDNKVFEQASRYNLKIKAKYLVVTNGRNHFCCLINHLENKYEFLRELPAFK